MELPGWWWAPVNCWSTGWLWFVVILVLRTVCTEFGISEDGDPTALLFLLLHSPRKSFLLFSLPAQQWRQQWSRLLAEVSLSASRAQLVCSQAQSSCWLPLGLLPFSSLVSGSPQLDTAHQKHSHSNVKWKEIFLCAHVTQKRSSVCGQVPETSVAIFRAR